jgi:hypothetical protein
MIASRSFISKCLVGLVGLVGLVLFCHDHRRSAPEYSLVWVGFTRLGCTNATSNQHTLPAPL